MRTARVLIAVIAGLLGSVTSIHAQGRAADEQARLRAAVEASGARMAEAYNNGDITGFVRAYADDVWLFPPNEQPFQGRQAALDYFRRSYDEGFRNFQLTTTGLDRQGAMAYETGTYSGELRSPGQNAPVRDNGKYVQVWKRAANGEWRTHFVMWSSNNPPPPTR